LTITKLEAKLPICYFSATSSLHHRLENSL
jgi:hypothetical protein